MIFVSYPISISSQKAYKPIRNFIKQKKGTEALNLIKKLEKDSSYQNDPKLYNWGKEANILIYEAENEKLYLKKQYDTIRFFNSIYGIYDYIIKCDNIETELHKAKGEKQRFRKANRPILYKYYKNIAAGGRYFFTKKKYQESMNLMKYFLDVPNMELWGDRKDLISSKITEACANIYQMSAYLNGDYCEVENYKDITLNDTSMRSGVMELLTSAAEHRKDTLLMISYLRQGLHEYPTNSFYFKKMFDFYTDIQQHDSAYYLAKSFSENYPDSTLYKYSKIISLLNLGDFPEVVNEGERYLTIDTSAVEINYYVGYAYCMMAEQIKIPTSINSAHYKEQSKKVKLLLRQAKPHLEIYKSKFPNEKEKWGGLLYKIYWSLNMGKQYDELVKQLKK